MKQPLLILGISALATFTMGWFAHRVFTNSSTGTFTESTVQQNEKNTEPSTAEPTIIVVDSPKTTIIETSNKISIPVDSNLSINKKEVLNSSEKATKKKPALRFHFDDFTAPKARVKSLSRPLEFRTCSSGKLYKSQTVAASKKGMNMAGKLAFCSIPCGPYCYTSTVVDLSTGKVYAGPDASTGYTYRADSRLLIVNDPQNIDCEECAVEYYVWTGNGFKRLK